MTTQEEKDWELMNECFDIVKKFVFEKADLHDSANKIRVAVQPDNTPSLSLFTKQQMIEFAEYHSKLEYNDESFSDPTTSLEKWLTERLNSIKPAPTPVTPLYCDLCGKPIEHPMSSMVVCNKCSPADGD